jgi:HD superfamily phosphohydrolase YqeK
MARVAELLDGWGSRAGLPDPERRRRRALGFLHDALRDADPEELRPRVPPELRDLPDPFLHGPAAARRLRREGLLDEDFLRAVAFHSLGHPGFEDLGRALYAADYLEPGRRFRPEWRAELRERFPRAPHETVVEVARARIGRLLEEGWELRTETVDFWNTLMKESLRGPA